MYKLMYVPKKFKSLNYEKLVKEQGDYLIAQQERLSEIEDIMSEAQKIHDKNCEIQTNLLMSLGNLNKCSQEELKEMQLLTENYMKIAINQTNERENNNG